MFIHVSLSMLLVSLTGLILKEYPICDYYIAIKWNCKLWEVYLFWSPWNTNLKVPLAFGRENAKH